MGAWDHEDAIPEFILEGGMLSEIGSVNENICGDIILMTATL